MKQAAAETVVICRPTNVQLNVGKWGGKGVKYCITFPQYIYLDVVKVEAQLDPTILAGPANSCLIPKDEAMMRSQGGLWRRDWAADDNAYI